MYYLWHDSKTTKEVQDKILDILKQYNLSVREGEIVLDDCKQRIYLDSYIAPNRK